MNPCLLLVPLKHTKPYKLIRSSERHGVRRSNTLTNGHHNFSFPQKEPMLANLMGECWGRFLVGLGRFRGTFLGHSIHVFGLSQGKTQRGRLFVSFRTLNSSTTLGNQKGFVLATNPDLTLLQKRRGFFQTLHFSH